MAIDMSPKVLKKFGIFFAPKNHILILFKGIRSAWRNLRINFDKAKKRKATLRYAEIIQHNQLIGLSNSSERENFSRNGYCFLNPFMKKELHDVLVKTFPERYYFSPMHHWLKTYDFGFRYRRGKEENIESICNLNKFNGLYAFYKNLASEDFSRTLNNFIDDGVLRSLATITTTWATSGSALIPHKDTSYTDPTQKKAGLVNFVIFVDAYAPSGGECGATTIYSDNEYKNELFKPKILKNTALLYNSVGDFYHGFRPMVRGSWRLTINAQFSAEVGE